MINTQIYVTLLKWNLFVTVGVLGFLGQELDPVLHLGDTAVHAVAWALNAIANHTHLRESNYIKYIAISYSGYSHIIPAILSHHQRASRVSLAGVLQIVPVTRADVEAKCQMLDGEQLTLIRY